MQTLNLDLGYKQKSEPEPIGGSGGYPTLYLNDVPEGIELPESGNLMVEFRRIEKTESSREDGESQCRYVLEIRKVISCDCDCEDEEDKMQSPSKKTESVLDALLKEVQAGKGHGE